ncbi:hypothetical protein [Pseudomonas putida]|uniref:hypothetical protein n=1 Tax=Pseudomonas putida TaxID=303 RepID=UPI001F51BDE4|nr:hypothetical protein [Pseudomonas putida]MCI1035840.1 hypothetical protein [Pseudomonas putida]
MNVNATRAKLVTIISEHHFSLPGKKLGIAELSERAGITRQAFNRYYADLKDYAWGTKPVTDLLDESSPKATDLLAQSHLKLVELNDEVETQQARFEKEKEKLRNSLITSLMNGDIVRFNANEIRHTLQKQLLHNEQLVRQIDELKLEAIKADQAKAAGNQSSAQPRINKIALEANLINAFAALHKNEDFDAYETHKSNAVAEVLEKVNNLARTSDSTVVIFIERYLSSFQKFVDDFRLSGTSQAIIVRLPIASRTELKSWIAKVIKPTPVHVHFPTCDAAATVKAQRAFHFRGIPEQELYAADQFPTVAMDPSMDALCIFRVRQGD